MQTLLLLKAIAHFITAFGQVSNYVPSKVFFCHLHFNENTNDKSRNSGTLNLVAITKNRLANTGNAYSFLVDNKR